MLVKQNRNQTESCQLYSLAIAKDATLQDTVFLLPGTPTTPLVQVASVLLSVLELCPLLFHDLHPRALPNAAAKELPFLLLCLLGTHLLHGLHSGLHGEVKLLHQFINVFIDSLVAEVIFITVITKNQL